VARSVSCELDHLVITAPTLAAGASFVEEKLGVAPQMGGEHEKMGTHNLLLRLGDSSYLEVIAPNPDAPRPERPRWFDLDLLSASSAPRLSSWIARTTDLVNVAAASPVALGPIESMSRGDLDWLITIPPAGMVLEGVAPALIEWRHGAHPAHRLRSSGCSLIRLKAIHPEHWRVTALLEGIGFQGPVSVEPPTVGGVPHLIAEIDTPNGVHEVS
jgi:hypothetical protein